MAEVYRLLVADDEYWIREQLRILVDWGSYGIEFLEPAVDGEDAYEKIVQMHPDIVITDINMPFICGVELVRRIKKEYPQIVTLILSGYSDFEYVRDSLTAGAADYILKPIEKMELIKAFTRALDLINTQKMLEKEKKVHRESLLRATSALNDREFSELIIHKKENYSSLGMEHLIPQMDEDNKGYCFMLIKINQINSLGEIFHYDVNLLSYTIKQRIRDKLREQVLFLFNNVYCSNEFIVAVKASGYDPEEQGYRLLLDLSDFMNRILVIGISECHYTESEYYDACQEASLAIGAKDISKRNKVISYSEMKDKRNDARFLSSEKKKTLHHMCKTDKTQISNYIFEIMGMGHCVEQRWTVMEASQNAESIIQILTEHAKEISRDPWEIQNEEVLSSVRQAIDDGSQEGICEVLQEFMETVLDMETEIVITGSGKDTIKSLEKYIEEHYYENLSVKSLAEMFHMDASYLSKLFKKEYGYNLVHYITMKKIDMAKKLISEDDKPLTEIAFLVGYDDYNYFNKVFRRIENISPREYRIKITGKNQCS